MTGPIKKQIPDWCAENMLTQVKADIEKNGEFVMQWLIKKHTMIAALNHIRSHGYKCDWIENAEDNFSIKITKKPV